MMRVLVGDKDPGLRGHLVGLLAAMGHRASAVAGAGALLRRAARRAPDAVLCDADFPDGDGIEACRRIKFLDPALTVVIMTGNRLDALRAAYAAFGPVLVKPFGSLDLQNVMTRVMLSRLKNTLSLAISDLRTQNDRIQAQIEGLAAAARRKDEDDSI